VTRLLVHPSPPAPDGTIVAVTPESAGWGHVGFEVLRLTPAITARRDTEDREVCIVPITGSVSISSPHGEWPSVGGRESPFQARPEAAYLPPRTPFELAGTGEVALCFAPAAEGAAARLLPASAVREEIRGREDRERTVRPILMGDLAAESLLVCEVITPGGHWSSYPPHKHDRDALPSESLLEETYYHRIEPSQGFALQRVYTHERDLDQTLAVGDGDTVLVPRGYHTVSAPPGYNLYYLNVMAGPRRSWAIHNDPDHEWLL
jgi:5-deoxy-glucuronate isomerase